MQLLSGYQLSKGAKFKADPSMLNLTMPLQMIPASEKDEQWSSMTMNWIEWEGLRQLRRNLNWMAKNYNMANEIIDKSDYIVEESQYGEIIAQGTRNGEEVAVEALRFYSFAPVVLNILSNEHATRQSKLTFSETGAKWDSEMQAEKLSEVEQVLLQQASIKQQMKMMQMGLSADSDEGKQMMNPATIKSLPDIQRFYTKDYKSIYQDWAEHQMHFDNDRFYMPEQERQAFKDTLVVDRCFFEMQMFENDYKVKKWNPIQTFYRKSPNERWISNAMWVGKVDLMTPSDAIDNYGWMMTEEQFETLNSIFPARSMQYIIDGTHPNDYYDATQSYEWNRTGPGLGTRQLMTALGAYGGMKGGPQGDVANLLFEGTEDMQDYNMNNLVRISTIYWKTQRKVGHLTKVDSQGMGPDELMAIPLSERKLIQDIVTEDYVITDKPIYNTKVYKEKSKINVVFGEHIDWFWMNEVWGGIKIGPNLPVYGQFSNNTGFNPIYIGMNGGKPGRVPFQFNGDNDITGCKLPVEGSVFSDYNSRSRSLLDKLKPWQIGFNLYCNQIMDLSIDELGVILTFDTNILPKHSLGEDWQKDSFPKAYSMAKDFKMFPYNTNRQNTEGAIQNRAIEVLDASQTNVILGKAKIAEWYKQQGLQSVGLNPERMGMPIDKQDTATGINQAVAASFSQTEHYFTQFCDELMPRVHQMRTDVAQYYASHNPSLAIQYTSNNEEKVNFQINGTELLGRTFGVMCKTRVNARKILNDVKQLLLTNNTSGANLFDLVRGIETDNLPEMNDLMTAIENRTQQEQQQKMQQEKQMHDEQLQQQAAALQEQQQFEERMQNEKLRSEEYQAQIRAASTIPLDTKGNDYEDYKTEMDRISKQQQGDQKLALDKDKHITQTALENKKIGIRQQEIQAEEKRTQAMLNQKRVDSKIKEKASKMKK